MVDCDGHPRDAREERNGEATGRPGVTESDRGLSLRRGGCSDIQIRESDRAFREIAVEGLRPVRSSGAFAVPRVGVELGHKVLSDILSESKRARLATLAALLEESTES